MPSFSMKPGRYLIRLQMHRAFTRWNTIGLSLISYWLRFQFTIVVFFDELIPGRPVELPPREQTAGGVGLDSARAPNAARKRTDRQAMFHLLTKDQAHRDHGAAEIWNDLATTAFPTVSPAPRPCHRSLSARDGIVSRTEHRNCHTSPDPRAGTLWDAPFGFAFLPLTQSRHSSRGFYRIGLRLMSNL
jgi:hypothetical protein